MGVEEIPLEELVRIKDFQVKEEVLPEEMVIREEGEVMMTLIPVMMGMGMIFPPPQTPLSQRKENRRDPNMFMYSKNLLVQRVKKVNLTSRKRWLGWARSLLNKSVGRDFKGPQAQFIYHRAGKLF